MVFLLPSLTPNPPLGMAKDHKKYGFFSDPFPLYHCIKKKETNVVVDMLERVGGLMDGEG